MNQRIRVVGIINTDEGVLVLRRNHGRTEMSVVWELPTGKIEFGEQPEEAMSRVLDEYVGVQAELIRVKDAITFLALNGSSQLNNLYIIYDVRIKEDVKISPNERYSAYKFLKKENIDNIRLDEATLAVLEIEKTGAEKDNISYREVANSATVYVDGCSRGNPGPSGVGYYIIGEHGQLLKRGGEFIGFATSRVAEYHALKEGIRQAQELGLRTVRFVSDSLMVVNQMKGIYQVKNKDVMPIYQDIKKELRGFEAVAFAHVKRLQNAAADKEANLAVERILKKE